MSATSRTAEANGSLLSATCKKVRLYLEMVRFSHTLFALPFAILSLVWGVLVPPPAGVALQVASPSRWIGVLLCMVTARNFAMSVNRWSDSSFDAINPRTANRHIPSGKITSNSVLGFALLNALAFASSCGLFLPNFLPLLLCVPVLLFIGGYSFAKRFTSVVHLWLGAALMLAPVCTWIAIRGEAVLSDGSDLLPAAWLGLAVMFWVTGFDIIYACQDDEVDRTLGLHSMATWLGVRGALRVAGLSHAIVFVLLISMGPMAPALSLGWLWGIAVVTIGGMLAYEHALVSPQDLTRVNVAFFHLNVIIGMVIAVVGIVDCCWR